MNFAVIKTGGKQYKVAANDLVKIEKLIAEARKLPVSWPNLPFQ